MDDQEKLGVTERLERNETRIAKLVICNNELKQAINDKNTSRIESTIEAVKKTKQYFSCQI